MTEFRAHDSEGLRATGVEYVRVSYPDLHGVCRSKDIPVGAFDAFRERGMSQTEAVMTIDLRHNIVSGFEHGFRDFDAVPDVGTLVRLPHDPTVAWCLADGRAENGAPFGLDPCAARSMRWPTTGCTLSRARTRVLPRAPRGYAPVCRACLVRLHLRPRG